MSSPLHQSAVALAMVGLVGAGGAASAESLWTDERICSAGLTIYFFLQAPPDLIGEIDQWHVFRSASGATIDCQLQGDVVAFRWKNDAGPMTSESTRYELTGDELEIHGDMGSASFRLLDGTPSLVE